MTQAAETVMTAGVRMETKGRARVRAGWRGALPVLVLAGLVAGCGDSGESRGLASGAAAEPSARMIDGSVVQGRFTARRWCGTCHAIEDDAAVAMAGAPPFRIVANRPGTTRESLLAFMDETHPVESLGAPIDMPTDVLYEREKADLTAFILSLQTGPEGIAQ